MQYPFSERLSAFNQLYKEMNEFYHIYAKRKGVSDTVLWLMYALCEKNSSCTQRELCNELHYPPQTVNSALKTMEKKGLIKLCPVDGNKKNKSVILTDKGLALSKETVYPLIIHESNAFSDLSDDEREALIKTTDKYVRLLSREPV